ncbi:MAG: hypothetical protein LVQ97_04880 [Candidatus Micrarchaeales archaeon]|jgi:hypothetical protein|uniref:Uncharacterized protein n=1 Tax=Candidatus Micrarchaeum acidiphilum ARMAN-2 TaxID=425595 RepID=C7DGV6_MICA2|nr:MAG: hypothetical protein UNLARM2_0306 [Candidatus Micrarchaeum acidiphilum ARMAN-2]MCW6161493.1 hypothetical protein [Candidatus Micrarchaeales archaeon]
MAVQDSTYIQRIIALEAPQKASSEVDYFIKAILNHHEKKGFLRRMLRTANSMFADKNSQSGKSSIAEEYANAIQRNFGNERYNVALHSSSEHRDINLLKSSILNSNFAGECNKETVAHYINDNIPLILIDKDRHFLVAGYSIYGGSMDNLKLNLMAPGLQQGKPMSFFATYDSIVSESSVLVAISQKEATAFGSDGIDLLKGRTNIRPIM